MNIVYVEGSPKWGLGNILFQVAAAIYYCEKYNYKLVLHLFLMKMCNILIKE